VWGETSTMVFSEDTRSDFAWGHPNGKSRNEIVCR
jgi:hypothetical protein